MEAERKALGEERCVMCGAFVPEGYMVCPNCVRKAPLPVTKKRRNRVKEALTQAVDKVRSFAIANQ